MTLNSTSSKEVRRFGCIALIFFGGLTALAFYTGKQLPIFIFLPLSLLGLFFLLLPQKSRPLYRGWLKCAHFIGRMITALAMIIAFYLVITPAGLWRRIFFKSPLPLLPNKNLQSYWQIRKEPLQSKEQFYLRY